LRPHHVCRLQEIHHPAEGIHGVPYIVVGNYQGLGAGVPNAGQNSGNLSVQAGNVRAQVHNAGGKETRMFLENLGRRPVHHQHGGP